MPYMTGEIMHIDDINHELWVCFLDDPYEVDVDKVRDLIAQGWEAYDKGIWVKSDELELLRDYEQKLEWIRQVKEDSRVCEKNIYVPLYNDAIWAYWDKNGFDDSPFYIMTHYHIVEVKDDWDDTIRQAIRDYLWDSGLDDNEIEDWVDEYTPNHYNRSFTNESPVSNKTYLFFPMD